MHYSPEQIGDLVKATRKHLGVTQRGLAMTSGSGLRFIIDLEKGKSTCQLGKVLTVLHTLGIKMQFTAPARDNSGVGSPEATTVRAQRQRWQSNSGTHLTMLKALDVYLHQDLVGQLLQDKHGQMVFSYAEAWLKHPGAAALSHSLPLREKQFDRNECRGFFGGILPEATNRNTIAKNLGISAKNDFALLERIGGECAGAVTFVPAGASVPERDYRYRRLTSQELAEILKTLPKRPLMAGDKDIRLSLAGAQDKIAVHVASGQISIPLGGAPSTHILKPEIERFEGMVFNEALCMKLAQAIGLHAASVEIGRVESIEYLLVERYDRKVIQAPKGPPHLVRMHQEDFCQALGIPSENKYQNEGGPSLKQCFALLRELSSAPVIDLQRLLDAVIFNFLVGNHDAHGKNFSLIYPEGADTRLAPLYDVLSTVYYPELSPKMAMKIGGEYVSDKISPKHFDLLAVEAGLAKPIVKRRVTELAEAVLAKIADLATGSPKAKPVAELIRSRCERTIRKFKPFSGSSDT